MPLIKIPRHYLVFQDEDLITVDVPESMLLHWKKDYEKIIQAKGILKHKKAAMLVHLDTLRQEDAVLITRNVGDFKGITGLKIENPFVN